MKDTEVLDSSLKQARKAGWNGYRSTYTRVYHSDTDHLMIEFFTDIERPPLLLSYEEVIFSHPFAESFWGLDTMYFVVHIDNAPGMQTNIIGWKTEAEMEASPFDLSYYDDMAAYEYHLQQLALEGDQTKRMAYLEKYLL